MYNDFVIVGPGKDPAGIAGMSDPVAALKKVANTNSKFASRGDDSGTDSKEKTLWEGTGVNQFAYSGGWYRETGSGMGTTLNTAVGMNAYTLSDRASWITHSNKGDFKIMVEGNKRLLNPYGIMLVDVARCPGVKSVAGKAFIDWLISKKGQKTIASFRIAGKQLFFPSTK